MAVTRLKLRTAALVAIAGMLACTADNPAFDGDGPAGESSATTPTSSTDAVTGVGPGPDGTATTGSQGSGTNTESDTDDSGDPTSPPEPCVPSEEHPVCHALEFFDLDDCQPGPVHIADLDDDMRGDVIVACIDGPLLVIPGQWTGLEEVIVLDVELHAPREIEVANLDSGGTPDIIVVNEVEKEGVLLLFQVGPLEFAAEPLNAAGAPTGVAAGRWFEGSAPDLAVTFADNTISAFRNDGEGVFTPDFGPIGVPMNPRDVAMANLDGDPGDELIIVSAGQTGMMMMNPNSGINIIYNDGFGEIMGPIEEFYDADDAQPERVIVNDIELDGDLDILAARPNADDMAVWRREDNNYSPTPEMAPVGGRPISLAAGDFDDNGLPDAVLAGSEAGIISFVLLIEVGELPVQYDIELLGPLPLGIAAQDIDQDGVPDVVASLPATNSLALLRSGQN